MPKFHVTLMKEVWEKATVVVEAADETAAENTAIALAETDEEIEWRYEETRSIDAIKVDEE